MANAVDTSEVPPLGPKMLALTAKQQGFVSALYDEEAPHKGDGLLIWAVKKAGYGRRTANKSASASRTVMVHDDKVLSCESASFRSASCGQSARSGARVYAMRSATRSIRITSEPRPWCSTAQIRSKRRTM